ncbi:hypothetical protein SDC9_117583 [bioreactor metagenome]|uniref:Uncharacterized protein n=1 Tax=bioreactor metagenome TaxID=1076179 RepID=A0A645BZW5_9ZZZZ
MEVQAAGLFKPGGIEFGDYRPKPQVPGHDGRHQPDGAAADNHGVVPRPGLGTLQRVKTHGKRLNQGSVQQADAVGQGM